MSNEPRDSNDVSDSGDPEETQLLLSRVTQGDRQALDRLLEIHTPFLERLLANRVDARMRARIDVADIIQETHMQVAHRIHDFLERRPMPFRLWLRKTACECMLQLRRKHVLAQARSVKRESPLPSQSSVILAERLLDNNTSPSGKAVKLEVGKQVRAAVEDLSEQDREILILRAYEGLTNTEAACVLEIRAEASRKRYTRALLRLSEALAARGLSEVRFNQ